MAKNDLLRSIRDVLNLDDTTMIQIFSQAGRTVGQSTISAMLKTEDQDEYIPCNDPIMGFFLDGLIVKKRGRRDSDTGQTPKPDTDLGNNAILKKLRIALDLKEDDMLALMALAGVKISKSELSALFRNKGHKHFKECGDQFLRNFLQGLTIRNRNSAAE